MFSPAKINLFLAVTGRRADGFHELLSLVAPLTFGDILEVEESGSGSDTLECDRPEIPADASNLVLKAARAFRPRTGIQSGFSFRLEKRIPAGGGFGGGSSNAARAIEAMNLLAGEPLNQSELLELAAEIGSDCPLFLEKGASIIRGRGEQVEPAGKWGDLLADWQVALFDPGVPMSTAALYGALAGKGEYTPGSLAEERLEKARDAFSRGDANPLLSNDLGDLLSGKNVFYGCWQEILSDSGFPFFGITGSGSGCFVLHQGRGEELKALVKQWIGEEGFLIESAFARFNDTG